MATRIHFKGELFNTLKELHSKHAEPGVSYASFYGRHKGGWPLEKALSSPQNKNTRKIFCVNGHTYSGMKDLASAAGLSYQTVVKRCERGWSDFEIFFGKPKKSPIEKVLKPRGKEIVVEGKTYENLRRAYDALKPTAKLNAVLQRLRNGKTYEEALEVALISDGRTTGGNVRLIQIKGIDMSITEASNRYGVPYSTICDKLARGATPEQAVRLECIPKRTLRKQSDVYASRPKREKAQLVHEGRTYDSVSDFAKAHGLERHVVYNRLKRGWPLARIIAEPTSDRVIVNGREFRSAMAAWDELGTTSFAVFHSRRSVGHHLDICLGLKPLREGTTYQVFGKEYPDLDAVSQAFEVSVSKLETRLGRMTIEEAVQFKPSNGKYTLKQFERNHMLAESPAFLYFVEIEFGSASLHKIGITRRTVESRLNAVEYRKIVLVYGQLLQIYQIEQALIREFKSNHWRADEDFEGRTETFLFTQEEESFVADYINKIVGQFLGCQVV